MPVLHQNLSHIDVKFKHAWFHAFLICILYNIFRERIVNAERFYSHTQTLRSTENILIRVNIQTDLA